MAGWDRQPALQTSPKTTSPSKEAGGEVPTIGSQHLPNTVGRIRRHLVTILTLKVRKVSVWKEYRQPFCSEGFPGHVCFLLPWTSSWFTGEHALERSKAPRLAVTAGAQQACGAASSFLLPCLGPGLCRRRGGRRGRLESHRHC